VCTSPKWHARRAAIEFAQNMIFYNLFNARPYVTQIRELTLKCLFDEQYEVRIATLMTLSGLYQCGYVKVTDEDQVKFSFVETSFHVYIATEILLRNEQDQSYDKNRWQESGITEKCYQTTWRLVYEKFRINV
jgi:hypothetical protein